MSWYSSDIDFPRYAEVWEVSTVELGIDTESEFGGFVDVARHVLMDDDDRDPLRVIFPSFMLRADLVDACKRIIDHYGDT